MLAGVSTSSFFPLETEKALRLLGENGIKNAELFVNDISEIRGAIFSEITSIISGYGMNIVSVHPFLAPLEDYLLFRDYKRRVDTFLDIYREFFEFAQKVGAGILVFHGGAADHVISTEKYAERYLMLADAAAPYSVTIAQENVHYCKSGSIDFLKALEKECGGRARFVLDIKQALREGYDPVELVNAVGESVIHVHMSDNRPGKDCIPIGQGTYDHRVLISALRSKGFDGALIVELYRSGFSDCSDLTESVNVLEKYIEETS